MLTRPVSGWGVGAALFLLAAPLWAQPDSFERGRELMLQERYDEACPLVQQSLAEDPRRGTLFTLAECERLRGHLASALNHYVRFIDERPAVANERERARLQVARQQLAELAERLPAVIIKAGAAPANVAVWLDGRRLARQQFNRRVFVEVGRHRVRFQAPGQPVREVQLIASRGERRIVELNFPAAGDSGPSAVAVAPPEGAPLSPLAITTIASGSLGVIALGVGAVTGGLAVSADRVAEANCVGPVCRNQEGVDAGARARSMATASTVGLVLGGVFATVASASALLTLTSSGDEQAVTARVGVLPYGARVEVTF